MVNDFSLFVDLNDAPNTTLHDGGVAVFQSGKRVHMNALPLVPIHLGRVVGPHDLLIEGHLGQLGPRVVIKNVSVWQKVYIMMPGMTPLRPTGLVRPDYLPVTLRDRENVFAVGGTHQHQSLCVNGD